MLSPPPRAASLGVAAARDVALIDLLDRLLQGGIAIHGDITLAAADIDLVEIDLRILVAAVDKVARRLPCSCTRSAIAVPPR
jgi:hypothetical protein